MLSGDSSQFQHWVTFISFKICDIRLKQSLYIYIYIYLFLSIYLYFYFFLLFWGVGYGDGGFYVFYNFIFLTRLSNEVKCNYLQNIEHVV